MLPNPCIFANSSLGMATAGSFQEPLLDDATGTSSPRSCGQTTKEATRERKWQRMERSCSSVIWQNA